VTPLHGPREDGCAGLSHQADGSGASKKIQTWPFAVPFHVLRHPEIPIAVGDLTGSAIEFFGFKLRPQAALKPVDLLRHVPSASMN